MEIWPVERGVGDRRPPFSILHIGGGERGREAQIIATAAHMGTEGGILPSPICTEQTLADTKGKGRSL